MRIPCTFKIIVFLVGILGVFIAGFWIGNRVLEVKNATKDCFSSGRFSQIKCMLLSYHEQHGAFPPTKYQPKPNGPIHSWRVLLMPYMDMAHQRRYSKYDFSQEWNSPKNMQAVGDVGDVFSMNATNSTGITNYVTISTGDEWPRPLKSLLVTKGEDHFLVVEYPNSDIHWMEPRDDIKNGSEKAPVKASGE